MDLNKIISFLLLVLIFFLIRDVLKNKSKGRQDIILENVRTLGAIGLLLLLAIGLFTTDKSFCELLPFFCK